MRRMAAGLVRLMPGYDPHWGEKLLPRLPDDATVEEVGHVMEMVLSAIEYTNSETF